MSTLIKLLNERHSGDLFVPECRMGPQGSKILDAWVQLRTWTPWTTIGYELKASRNDFLKDRKWVEYLPVCHELYFVCEPKLIAPEELPENVGLLWRAGHRLYCKRKAVRREVDHQKISRLMSYLLMSRTRLVANMWEANGTCSTKSNSRSERMAQYRMELEERQTLDGIVRERVSNKWRELQRDIIRSEMEARKAGEALKKMQDALESRGVQWDGNAWTAQKTADQLENLVRGYTKKDVELERKKKQAINELEDLLKKASSLVSILHCGPLA